MTEEGITIYIIFSRYFSLKTKKEEFNLPFSIFNNNDYFLIIASIAANVPSSLSFTIIYNSSPGLPAWKLTAA
ncbi:hypothetical protein IJS64_03305 [bacterium]|jgi:hypothetical protein|nr:hypothetical protein [bacterium]